MIRGKMSRHGWILMIGLIYAVYVFWYGVRFGYGRMFPSFRDVPLTSASAVVLALAFAASLLGLPMLLLIARSTRSLALRGFGLLLFAKAYPCWLVLIGIILSLENLPRRDWIQHACLRRPDPERCASVHGDTFAVNRYFTRAQLAEIQRVARRAKDFEEMPGDKQARVKQTYAELKGAYEAGDYDRAQELAFGMLQLAPNYRDTHFYLHSAGTEKWLQERARREREIAYWKKQPGRGVASLEKEALRIMPLSRESTAARRELLQVLERIYERDPANRTGRRGMHELGIWEAPLK